MRDEVEKAGGDVDPARRDLLKKAIYAAPVVLSLPVLPAFAQEGSAGGGGMGMEMMMMGMMGMMMGDD